MRRMVATIAATLLTLGVAAGPALAHPHDQAHNGFVGPTGTPVEASDGTAGVAHRGIQCAQDHGNPHLGDLGLDCPAG